MRNSLKRSGVCLLLLVLAASSAPSAFAFYPIGGFDQFGQLYLRTWPLRDFDTNNDGQVTSDEGLEVFIEGGPSGFTPSEIQIVRDSLQVWEDVPTSYASFRVGGIVTDPIIAGISPDFIISIVMQVTEAGDPDVIPDIPDVIVPGVAFPVLGVNITFFTVEPVIVTIEGVGVHIAAGTIIDSDIVIAADSHRPLPDGTPPLVELKSTMVHELGHLLGLAHPPLNNLQPLLSDPADPSSIEGFVEQEVFWHTQPNGIPRFIGVTPSMFAYAYETADDLGGTADGSSILAPNDISAISWLYPRGSQNQFFGINGELRSRSRSPFPTYPIVGGHVVAWADVDNSPGTSRVPMFSTISGLYTFQEYDAELGGRFQLHGLWKQFEVPRSMGGALFNPTYVLTVNPLNGTSLEGQAPPGEFPAVADSIQGPNSHSVTTRGAGDYITVFSTEVFRETENIFGLENREGGTPLVWDFQQDRIVSADTGRSLQSMVQGRPMFGSPDEICPLNLIFDGPAGDPIGGGGAGPGDGALAAGMSRPDKLRWMRDNVLLKTAAGTAVVDLYYSAAPSISGFLLSNVLAYNLFRSGVFGMFWMMEHVVLLLAGLGLAGLLWAGARRRLRRAASTGALLVALACAGLFAQPAEARIAFVTTPQMTEGANAIVTGKVAEVTSRLVDDRYIVTDVILEVDQTVKGAINKGSEVTVSVLGGRVGGLVMQVSEMPTFQQGQSVLLYLREEGGVYGVHGGIRGTFAITTKAETGEKAVGALDAGTGMILEADAKAVARHKSGEAKADEEDAEDAPHHEHAHGSYDGPGIELDAYLDYLRDLVREQAAQSQE